VSGELVLVTGGSGFVGAHCILKLLDAGYRVRTTVRSLEREADVRAMLTVGGAEPGDALMFAAVDLLSDDGWPEAVAGCDFVLHVASPFPVMMPKDDDELIRPAREGALRALRAARDGGVKRVVLTSSFAAIGYGPPHADGSPFSEEDWTDPNGQVSAYVKSKTLAERAAWDFIDREGGDLELAVVNPVGIFGPVLGKDVSSSIELVRRMMNGSLPALPHMFFGVVDVRDVADLHLRAMTDPAAAGNRFLAIAGEPMTLPEMAAVLRERLGPAARRVSKRVMPDSVVKSIAFFVPSLRQIVPELGRAKPATSEKARRVLGWDPRSNEDALTATGESLVRLGVVGQATAKA
jgi:nucleoside-diphosphate-sugar epimerase